MLRLLRNRGFALFLAGQTVSGLGSWVDFVGLNLYFHHLFGSGRLLGLFLVVRTLPALLFGTLGGWLADRYPRRRLMICCNAARALLVLGFLATSDLGLFFVIGLTLSALDKIFMSAQGAYVPALVSREELLAANSLIRTSQSLVTIAGPALGGALVAASGYAIVFVCDSASFLFSVACLVAIGSTADGPTAPRPGSVRAQLGATLSFLAGHRLLAYMVLVRLVDALGSGAYNTCLPILGRTLSDGGAAYGPLVAVWACGELAGSLAAPAVLRRFEIDQQRLFTLSVVVMALGMGAAFRCGSVGPALAAIFAGGVGDGLGNVLFSTGLMSQTPDGLRGKVFGTVVSSVYTTAAMGMALGGLALDRHGVSTTTDGATGFILLSAAAVWALCSSRWQTSSTRDGETR